MNNNLNEMKCADLRIMARQLGIKGGKSKGKGWLIPEIEAVLLKQEQERKAAEEAAKAAEKPAKRERKANLISFNGKSQSIGAWAKELGMPVPTLRARLRNGWTIDQALSKESAGRNEKLIEHDGKAMTLSAWARELGVARATLDARINRLNWSPDKAFTCWVRA